MSDLKILSKEEYETLDSLMKEMLTEEKYLEFKSNPDDYRRKIKPIVEILSIILKG